MSSPLPPKETLPRLIRRALATPRADVLVERAGDRWTPTSSQQLLDRVENLSCAIRDAGLASGDRVALIAHDCIDWIVCDFATFFAGCVVVPIFPTQALDQTDYILRHSEAKLLFIDRREALERLRAYSTALPPAIVFEGDGSDTLRAWEARGAQIRAAHPDLPRAYEPDDPDALAVLIYTSGTTGQPKGVMLSHDNIGFDAQSALMWAMEDLGKGSVVLSVLPFSHIFEHTIIYIYLLAGTRYYICHDPDELARDLREVRPEGMTSVPRIFDRVLAAVKTQAMKESRLRGNLVEWALETGRAYAHARTFGPPPSPGLRGRYALAKRLVLDKVRRRLGLDRLRYFTSGSAALHVDVSMTYLGLGLPIVQGYGLTETSPVITVNRPSDNRYGTVGKPIPGVEVRLADDGEILTRGRHVMLGYYRDPEATAEALEDGWLHTGDIGRLDDGYLSITDRKKEIFKTANGKFVVPARIESAIKRSPFIAQALVVGDGRPHPAALVCPNWELVRVQLALPPDAPPEELAARDEVREFISAQVRRQTEDLAEFEQIRRVIVIPREFSIENGELSPSMKVKRRVVEQHYAAEIERAYGVDLHQHAYV
jgi:long-chain acyl-CoA synthetase